MTALGDDERAGRVERLLEELRLNTEDLHELAREAMQRAKADRENTQLIRGGAATASSSFQPDAVV
jgi:hypothetical protein